MREFSPMNQASTNEREQYKNWKSTLESFSLSYDPFQDQVPEPIREILKELNFEFAEGDPFSASNSLLQALDHIDTHLKNERIQ